MIEPGNVLDERTATARKNRKSLIMSFGAGYFLTTAIALVQPSLLTGTSLYVFLSILAAILMFGYFILAHYGRIRVSIMTLKICGAFLSGVLVAAILLARVLG